jgi:hypothetical protein
MPFLLIHNNVPDSAVVCHAKGGITLKQSIFNCDWRICLISWDLIFKLSIVACNIAVDRVTFV